MCVRIHYSILLSSFFSFFLHRLILLSNSRTIHRFYFYTTRNHHPLYKALAHITNHRTYTTLDSTLVCASLLVTKDEPVLGKTECHRHYPRENINSKHHQQLFSTTNANAQLRRIIFKIPPHRRKGLVFSYHRKALTHSFRATMYFQIEYIINSIRSRVHIHRIPR